MARGIAGSSLIFLMVSALLLLPEIGRAGDYYACEEWKEENCWTEEVNSGKRDCEEGEKVYYDNGNFAGTCYKRCPSLPPECLGDLTKPPSLWERFVDAIGQLLEDPTGGEDPVNDTIDCIANPSHENCQDAWDWIDKIKEIFQPVEDLLSSNQSLSRQQLDELLARADLPADNPFVTRLRGMADPEKALSMLGSSFVQASIFASIMQANGRLPAISPECAQGTGGLPSACHQTFADYLRTGVITGCGSGGNEADCEVLLSGGLPDFTWSEYMDMLEETYPGSFPPEVTRWSGDLPGGISLAETLFGVVQAGVLGTCDDPSCAAGMGELGGVLDPNRIPTDLDPAWIDQTVAMLDKLAAACGGGGDCSAAMAEFEVERERLESRSSRQCSADGTACPSDRCPPEGSADYLNPPPGANCLGVVCEQMVADLVAEAEAAEQACRAYEECQSCDCDDDDPDCDCPDCGAEPTGPSGGGCNAPEGFLGPTDIQAECAAYSFSREAIDSY